MGSLPVKELAPGRRRRWGSGGGGVSGVGVGPGPRLRPRGRTLPPSRCQCCCSVPPAAPCKVPAATFAAMADSRLLLGARPAPVINAAWARAILPVVIGDLERSIAVAQLQGWIGQHVATRPPPSGSDPDRARRRCHRHALFPSMKPAMTMLPPVPQKARVLILASLRVDCLIQVVDFHQRDTGRVTPLPFTIAVYAPGASVATIADSRSLVGGMPVAWIAVLLGVSPVVVADRGKSGRTVQFQHRISQHIGDRRNGSTKVRSPARAHASDRFP